LLAYSISDYFHAMRYALLVGPIIAASCSLLSVFVVLRGMAMISEGVAHAGVGGLSIALLIGFFVSFLDTPLWQQIITCVFCTNTALLIGYVTRGKKVSEDSAIGIFLAATMALGIFLLSIRHSLHGHGSLPPSMEEILFGSIMNTLQTDVYITLSITGIIFAVVFSMYHAFIYTALDEDMARINGVPVKLINVLLLVMVSVLVVVAGRMVGLLLINALMIIPGATAKMISRSFGRVLVASLLIGTLGVGGSLLLVILMAACPPLDHCPPGPVIVLTLFLIFAVVWIIRNKFRPKVIETEPANVNV
jgi:zinc transport system permease protein